MNKIYDYSGKNTFLFIIFFSLYYLSYRYPFQIGSSNTSPTYTDTPVILQIIKYVVLGILVPFAFYRIRIRSIFSRFEIIVLLLSFYIISVCVIISFIELAVATQLFEIGFTLVFMVAASSFSKSNLMALDFIRITTQFFYVNIVVTLVQLVLFLIYNRLPALGYDGGNVRFGGVWDDPNSALFPYALVLPMIFAKFGISLKSLSVLFLAIVAMALAQSATASAALILASAITFMIFYKGMNIWSKLTIMSMIFALMLTILFLFLIAFSYLNEGLAAQLQNTLWGALEIKIDSAISRDATYSLFSYFSTATYLGFDPIFKTGENQFINIIGNFGIFVFALFLFIHTYVVYALYVWCQLASNTERRIALSSTCFFLWYCISMLNIPVAEVFPVNLMAAVVAAIALSSVHRLGVGQRYHENMQAAGGQI